MSTTPTSRTTPPTPGGRELLRGEPAASRIGREVGAHLRVDFFSAADGLVFDEFATPPLLADRRYITPLGDEMLGRIWQEEIADAV